MRELLGKLVSKVSALALALAAAVSAVLGYLTSNWLVAVIVGLSILLAVLLVLIVVYYIRREREQGLEAGLAQPDEADRHEQSLADTSRLGALQARFVEAVEGIRKDFRGRNGVYELPWLLLIGDEDAGKSTLLAECGLDLPAQYARRGFGPTDTIEFVRANELIALDTSSRYLTCRSEQDTREWQRLLALLRRNRPDLPLEAVVFAISLDRLLGRAPAELEELARALRLRLNEIRVRLRIDVPIYIVVTKAEQMAGFAALAQLLRPEHARQAFGWTNSQRRLPDPEQRVLTARAELADRLEAMLPELMLREPDSVRQRALFALPADLMAAAEKLAGFVGIAFKKDVYSESTPFLRGVYFTSARSDGGSGPLFLRELVLEVIRGDHTLALRQSSIGPLGRRAIQGAAAIAALWLVWAWGTSFWQNYEGSALLADRAAAVLSKTPGASQIDALRGAIEAQEHVGRSPVHWIGYPMLWRALDNAKADYASIFEKHIDTPTKARLRADLQREDEQGVQAAMALASDIDWLLGNRSDLERAPQLESYAPRIVRGLDFRGAYVAYSRWLSERGRADLVRTEQEQLALASGRLLKLPVLEEITSRERGPFPPARRTELGFPPPANPGEGLVPGIYTASGRERLISPLLAAIERSGSVAPSLVKNFKHDFAQRFDEVWRAYLLDGDLAPAERSDIAKSPYLALLAQVEENTKGDVPGRDSVPPWLEAFREVRRTLPLAEVAEAALKGAKPADAPWVQYKAALDATAVEAESAGKDGPAALGLAHQAAVPQPTEFSHAIDIVAAIVPRSGDAAAVAKLRKILEMPFLDAFSALMRSAMLELESLYHDEIVKRFSGTLSKEATDELCGKGGALETFVDGEVKPFLRGTHPRPLLEDRAMPLGPAFASLLDTCAAIRIAGGGAAGAGGAGGGPGEESFTLTGVPAAVDGAPGMLVTSRVFEMSCEGKNDELRYSEGNPVQKKFDCHPGCELTLSLVVAAGSGAQQEVSKSWRADSACSEFLAQGKSEGGEIREWRVAGPDGSTIRARFRVKVADKPKGPASKRMQIPAGLGG